MSDNKILSLFSNPSDVKNISIQNVDITFLCIVKILRNNCSEFNNIINDGGKIFDVSSNL